MVHGPTQLREIPVYLALVTGWPTGRLRRLSTAEPALRALRERNRSWVSPAQPILIVLGVGFAALVAAISLY